MVEQAITQSRPMKKLRQSKGYPVWATLGRVVVILFADLLAAVSLENFLVPANILSGGITGVTQLIYHLTGWPIGLLYLLFNVPLFALGYKYLGKRFILLTGVAILGFSLMTDWVHLHLDLPLEDPLIISLYGGVLAGLASGLVIRVGGSMGGTDILSLVINRVSGKSVGGVSFTVNVVVVLLSLGVFGVKAGMYTLVSMFAAARVVNALLHFQARKTALVISPKSAEISEAITRRLNRGSTLIQGHGTYTKAQLGVLVCVLTHLELAELRALATEIDPHVFISVLDTAEVVGHFRHLPI
ncbi:YitT family protein [Alicyclobacillus kakegawensis]|uniref:YitT family protein n=1 Tax=Alicyclobacillus kakegawensis TaxID=392012 RepID=UPI000AA8F944|nr:YitT family protein [Alicyclobacillus kakegawensis]